MVQLTDVFSSHVSQIGHDAESGDLIVKWDTGKTSAYANVPVDVAQSVMRSWSVGKALTESVKGVYEHRYI